MAEKLGRALQALHPMAHPKVQRISAIALSLILAVVGSYLIQDSRAGRLTGAEGTDTYVINAEAEDGTVDGDALIDTGLPDASGGSAVRFGVTPPTPPPPTPPPVGGTLKLTGNFDTGNFTQYGNCQWFNKNGSCGASDPHMAAVVDGGPGHPTAARFEVRSGDVPPFGGGERSEVRVRSADGDVVEGDERWYEFSIKVDSDFQPCPGPTSGGHCIVMQWHPGSGSPIFHLSVDTANNLIIGHRWDSNKIVMGALDPGNWHHYVLHVKHSNSASTGFVEAWRDGVQTIPQTPRATLSSASSYVKLGLYRNSESFTQVIWYDDVRITAP